MTETAAINTQALKLDVLGRWVEQHWLPRQSDSGREWVTIQTTNGCVHEQVILQFEANFELPDGYAFAGSTMFDLADVPRIFEYSYRGELTYRTGAHVYRFAHAESGATLETLIVSAYYADDTTSMTILAAIPRDFIGVWTAFSRECDRRAYALAPDSKIIVIGGTLASFETKVQWDDIVLPAELKASLQDDVHSFFSKGIDVYRRLNLKPFRKLLLAGVPGTGKTMICSALANWALAQQYLVIYISSADRRGAVFNKIQEALEIASNSEYPTLLILEEMDAYLRKDQKALVLNVLDGSESSVNMQGTLMVATTNYPEAIDERVLKRPGRLDRIFIIPETQHSDEAETMLRRYLGDMWRDEHRTIAEKLVGFPGAFIREVAIYALTQVAYDDLAELPVALLDRSFVNLKDQIDAKDDFLLRRSRRKGSGFGFESVKPTGNGFERS